MSFPVKEGTHLKCRKCKQRFTSLHDYNAHLDSYEHRKDKARAKVYKGFRDIETGVRFILTHYPYCRGDDKLLVLRYWAMFDKIKIPQSVFAEVMKKGHTFETLTRVRRKVQEKGDFLPSKAVQAKRRRAQQRFLEAFGKR